MNHVHRRKTIHVASPRAHVHHFLQISFVRIMMFKNSSGITFISVTWKLVTINLRLCWFAGSSLVTTLIFFAMDACFFTLDQGKFFQKERKSRGIFKPFHDQACLFSFYTELVFGSIKNSVCKFLLFCPAAFRDTEKSVFADFHFLLKVMFQVCVILYLNLKGEISPGRGLMCFFLLLISAI